MYLILHANFDEYCGGDFTFCKDKKELLENIRFISKDKIIAIYNLKNKKDIKFHYLT